MLFNKPDNSSTDTVDAFKYKVKYLSATVRVHWVTMDEYYIPSLKIAFNEDGAYRCENFESKEFKTTLEPVPLSKEIVDKVKKIVELRVVLKKAEEELQACEGFSELFAKQQQRLDNRS